MNSRTERRSSERCIANCQCWIEQESITLFGTVTNLSRHGLFLQTLPILEADTEIDIRLSLHDGGDLLAKGRVAWKSNSHGQTPNPENPGGAPGLGIEFQSIKQGQELLPDYLSKRPTAGTSLEKKL